MTKNRVPPGVPTGGQFAATSHDEADVALSDDPWGEPLPSEEDTIGEARERIPIAEVRRQLAEGTETQVVYLGTQHQQEGPNVRTVTKQNSHEMICTRSDGTEVHNRWAKVTAEKDSAGNIILRDADGTPYAAFIPLTDGRRPIEGPDIRVPRLDYATATRSTDSDRLTELAASEVPMNRKLVAENPHTPQRALRDLGEDENVKVRRAVAANPNAHPEVLDRLAFDPDTAEDGDPNSTKVRWHVAANPGTVAVTLDHLAKDDDPAVRSAVARHTNTTPDALRSLTQLSGHGWCGDHAAPSAAV